MRLSGIFPALALAVTVRTSLLSYGIHMLIENLQAATLPSGSEHVDSGIEGAKIVPASEAPFPIAEPQWEVEVFPGEERQHFTGTIEVCQVWVPSSQCLRL